MVRNDFGFDFLFIKEYWQKASQVPKNIKQHNCFQH